ncbi:MAG TPA: GNAT family N-acetyltransferase [Burkholderiaceae bacterium]|nr:GNAT family N-acetyltransferase [Burkholderiaceae bacterium]
MNHTVEWQVTEAPDDADLSVVDNGLHTSNLQAADLDAVKPIACFVRSTDGVVIGGLRGRTWGEACEIQQLWVAAAWRRRGLGSELLARLEAAARERGITEIYLDTFSFQAPSLYQRAGFRVACEIAGFPGGIVKYVMRKTLNKEGIDR